MCRGFISVMNQLGTLQTEPKTITKCDLENYTTEMLPPDRADKREKLSSLQRSLRVKEVIFCTQMYKH